MARWRETERMSEGPKLYVGVDLGGTKIAVSLWGERAGGAGPEALGKCRWETLREGPGPNLDRIVSEARRLVRTARARGAGSLAAIGVSGGGPLDPETGTILSIPNLPGWQDVPIARFLSESLEASTRLENDANSSAVAEWLYGAGRGARNLAFLTCSTGIGAGLILDGRLYRGSGFLAGEVGHQKIVPEGLPCGCGGRGCLEAYASGAGIARRLAAIRASDPALPSTAKEVVDRARGGDPWSARFLAETAEYLAMGLANLIFVLNPDRIVLGTIVVGAGGLLLGPLRTRLEGLVWPELLRGLEVVPAALGHDLGDRAALAVARDLPGLLDPQPTLVGTIRPESGQEPRAPGTPPDRRPLEPPRDTPPGAAERGRGNRKSRSGGGLDPPPRSAIGPDS
jgi:glucokinase